MPQAASLALKNPPAVIMDYRDYIRLDATALAGLIADRQITAAEALATARDRLDAVNGSLNAVIARMDEIADARAATPVDGVFAGVPFLLKDLNQDYAGVPSTYGNRALKRSGFRPGEHAEITRRFIASGVNILGKTNTPEFGAKGITEPEANGVTRNPWQLDHTPGGSSGGSAAAVAAGIVPMAGANDAGGSIRIPAACCGLFGFKPGRARVPGGPQRSDNMQGASVDHVITRSVRDSAAMLDATAGYEPGAIARLAEAETSYVCAIARPPSGLRIGMLETSPFGPLHADATAALATSATLLGNLGHHIEPAAPAHDGAALCQDFLLLWFTQMAVTSSEVRAMTGSGPSGFELDTRAMAHIGRALPAADYVQICNRLQHYRRTPGGLPQPIRPPAHAHAGHTARADRRTDDARMAARGAQGPATPAFGPTAAAQRHCGEDGLGKPEACAVHSGRQPHRHPGDVGAPAHDRAEAAARQPVHRATGRRIPAAAPGRPTGVRGALVRPASGTCPDVVSATTAIQLSRRIHATVTAPSSSVGRLAASHGGTP